MKKCHKCGKINHHSHKFCVNCGTKLKIAPGVWRGQEKRHEGSRKIEGIGGRKFWGV